MLDNIPANPTRPAAGGAGLFVRHTAESLRSLVGELLSEIGLITVERMNNQVAELVGLNYSHLGEDD